MGQKWKYKFSLQTSYNKVESSATGTIAGFIIDILFFSGPHNETQHYSEHVISHSMFYTAYQLESKSKRLQFCYGC